ncbi:hypothetical protein 9A_0024 [Streptococcus phage 9A]|uniref:TcdA-E operon negative regulator n=4 Tax=Moineauvirus TaxID=1623304 RepID=A0A286QQF7_9CAUD|nr:hypothetical protein PP243_gp27 [Streptococcus phage P7631]YP_010647443.1 hypothetical protein PP245_gp25 [Streptococcus phage P7633]YP_010648078.1 hypothetical protein if_gp25 [Streptococcus phage SW7]YP_010648160.1 hypothetical protein PP259_gp24 [Streptococcus phage SWK3]ATI19575.1 hypothetical protein 9A_0024 [Streptococcus phage 9A]AYP29275.1 hypothetical protein SW21_024 [Streptococcus phage SW21]AYP30140.1 hypothetical protein SWK2_025 [Streptococcus phage SWK2]AYP30222.1 hypotheti
MWLLLSLVGFLGYIVSIGALLWSVIKKNKDLRKKSLIGGLLAMIMFFIGALISPTDKSESSVETAKTEQTSSSKKKNAKTSSSSKKEASSSSKTVSSTETSSTSKTYDDAANTAFASELDTKINDVLKQSGITDSFAVMPNSSVLIDVVVPQDYKYLPNSQIQQLADTLLYAKENFFQEWNAKPENNYNETYGPRLYVKSPDGTTLAKESFFGGKMKRVIDNK